MSNYIFICGYNNKLVVDRTLRCLHNTRSESDVKVCILNQHYPGVEREFYERWVNQLHNAELYDAGKNLGLHEGLNYLAREVGVTVKDIVIVFDPDTRPISYGWDAELIKACQTPDIGWASLWNCWSGAELVERGFTQSVENGQYIWTAKAPCANSISAFQMDWVLPIGWREDRPLYGGLECVMWPYLEAAGKRWVWLPNTSEGRWENDMLEEEYKFWKWAHVSHEFPESYDQWLLKRPKKDK